MITILQLLFYASLVGIIFMLIYCGLLVKFSLPYWYRGYTICDSIRLAMLKLP